MPYATEVITPGAGSQGAQAVAFSPSGELVVGSRMLGSNALAVMIVSGKDGSLQLAKTIREDGHGITLTAIAAAPNGDVVVLGTYSVRNEASTEMVDYPWFARIDSSGNLIWQTFDKTPGLFYRTAVAVDRAGSIMAAIGDRLWSFSEAGVLRARATLSIAGSAPHVSSITPTDAGFVLAGAVGPIANLDAVVVTVDTMLTAAGGAVIAGAKSDQATGVAPTADGYYVTGTSASWATGVWAFKLDTAFDLVWQKSIGTRAFGGPASGIASANGKATLVGHYETSNEHLGIVAARLDTNGSLEAARGFGEGMMSADAVFATASGVRFAGGRREESPFLVSTDANLTVPGCVAPMFAGVDLVSALPVSTTTAVVTKPVMTLTPASTALLPTNATSTDATLTSFSDHVCRAPSPLVTDGGADAAACVLTADTLRGFGLDDESNEHIACMRDACCGQLNAAFDTPTAAGWAKCYFGPALFGGSSNADECETKFPGQRALFEGAIACARASSCISSNDPQ